MKRVLASGVFDILHPGHLHYLTEARKHGDHLSVVVASDGHATRNKRVPRHTAAQRTTLLQGLSVVDDAFIGSDPYDLAATLRHARPDVIALGHDQPFDADQLVTDAAAVGFWVEVVRIDHFPESASTQDFG